MAFDQWSRPPSLLILGVRPNSPRAMTSVVSSRPRWSRSWISDGDGPLEDGQPLVARLEDADVMVPAAFVERDERHAGLDQPAGQQAALADGRAAVRLADGVRLAADVERGLGLLRADQVVALLVVLVEGHHRVARRRLGDPPEPIDAAPQVAPAVEPGVGSPRRAGTTSRTRKPSRFGLSGTTNGAYFAPRKFGPPERDIAGIEKYAGRPWFDAPRSWATTEPRLGWKLTNAPQPTGIRGGAPVIM